MPAVGTRTFDRSFLRALMRYVRRLDAMWRRGVFRRRITVLELQQIIGRGRGLWRTADNPLHVLVLTDVPLDMAVEELTTDAAERPSFEDRQIAVGAIAFECAAHAAKVFPEMWKDADRAQYARRQHGRGQPAGTIAWQYRIAGQGERPWRVYAPPSIHNQQAPRSNLLTRSQPPQQLQVVYLGLWVCAWGRYLSF